MSNTQASRKQQTKIAKIIAKTASISRPSVNFAKDRLDQLFLIPGLVWTLMYLVIFGMVTPGQPTNRVILVQACP